MWCYLVPDLERIVEILPYPNISAILMGEEALPEGAAEEWFYAALASRLNGLKERDEALLINRDGSTATLSGKELLGMRKLYISMNDNRGSVDLLQVMSVMRAMPKLPTDLQYYLQLPEPLLRTARQVLTSIGEGYEGNNPQQALR